MKNLSTSYLGLNLKSPVIVSSSRLTSTIENLRVAEENGADTVQVCSVLYQKGLPFLKVMNQQISEWMTKNNFKSISDFRGKLNWLNYQKPGVFERTQFMKYFTSVD